MSSEPSISDRCRALTAITARDVESAKAMIDQLHTVYIDLISSYVEWVQAWPRVIAEYASPQIAEQIKRQTYLAWREHVLADEETSFMPDGQLLLAIFTSLPLEVPIACGKNIDDTPYNPVAQVNAVLHALYDQICTALDTSNFGLAAEYVDLYFNHVREQHDLLVLLIQTYAATVNKGLGQEVTEHALLKTLSSCEYYDAFWKRVERTSPKDLAFMLVEEFKAHFSGPNREGSVKMLEEEDCYRVVFDPCGSGGTMRRNWDLNHSTDIDKSAVPSPATWNISQVPLYCMHCAQNELTSIERLGYPAWVTEFDPDISRPCGWTVYKSPSAIPSEYVDRLCDKSGHGGDRW